METSVPYPEREPYFAIRFCRLLSQSEVAQAIGPEACWLLNVIVTTEDARRYTSPVTFYNGQLQTQCGFDSENRLNRHRQRAVDAGWLHYEAGGKSRPGVYWVTIPEQTEAIDTPSTKAVTPELSLQNGGANGGTNGGKAEGQTGDKRRPSYPIPDPIPKPINTSLPSKPSGTSSGRSGRGFDKRDLGNAGKVIAFAQQQGIDTADHRNRLRCLTVAIQVRDAKKPAGMFVHLIRKGAAGDWSTVSDEPHEAAKRWLDDYDRANAPASSIPTDFLQAPSPVAASPQESASDQAARLREWNRKREGANTS